MRWVVLLLGISLIVTAAVQAPACPVINSTLLAADQQPPAVSMPVAVTLNFLGLPRAGSQTMVYVEGGETYVAISGGHTSYGLTGGDVFIAGDPTPTDGMFNITILINYYEYSYDEYYVIYNCSGIIKEGTLAVIKNIYETTYSVSDGGPIDNAWSNSWVLDLAAPYPSLPTTWFQGPDVSDSIYISVNVKEPRTLSGFTVGQINEGYLGVKAEVNSTDLVLGDDAQGLPQDNPFKASYSPSYFVWSPAGSSGVLSGSLSLLNGFPSSVELKAWFVPRYWVKPLSISPPNVPGVIALRTSYVLLNQTSEGLVALLDPASYRTIAETYISQWGNFPAAVSHLLALAMPEELPSMGPFALSFLASGSGGWYYYNLYTYAELPTEALWEPYVWLGSVEIWLEGGSLNFYIPQGGIVDFYTSLYGYLIYGGHYIQYMPEKYNGAGGYVVEAQPSDNVAWNGDLPGALIQTEMGGFGSAAVLTPWTFPAPYGVSTYGLAMMYSRWSYRSSPDYIWASLIPSNYSMQTVAVDPVTGYTGTAQGVVFTSSPQGGGQAYPADLYVAVLQPWPSERGSVGYISTFISHNGKPSGVVVWSLVPLIPCRSIYCVDPGEAWWNGQFVGDAALRGAAYGLAVMWLGNEPVDMAVYINASGARYVNGTWAGSTWPSAATYNISLGVFTLRPYVPYLILPGSAVPLPNATSGCAFVPTPPGWLLTPVRDGIFWVEFVTPQGTGLSYYYTTGVELNYTFSNFFTRILSPTVLMTAFFCQPLNGSASYPPALSSWFPSSCLLLRWLPLVISQGQYPYWTAGCLNGSAYIAGDLRPYGGFDVGLNKAELLRVDIKYIYIKPKIYINLSGIYIYVDSNSSIFIKGYYFYLSRNGTWVLRYFCPGRSLYIPWSLALKLKIYPWDPARVVPAINYSSSGSYVEYPVPLWSSFMNWWSLSDVGGPSDLTELSSLGCVKI